MKEEKQFVLLINDPRSTLTPTQYVLLEVQLSRCQGEVRSSALILCFSDGWDQATGGFIVTDWFDGESIHRIDLYGPQVGILWFICKPCLFWEPKSYRDKEGGGTSDH